MGKQETFTKKEALKLLKYKDGQGKNTKIAEFNQKIAEWRASNPGKKFELRIVALDEADLHGADLNNADLSGADLRNADLSGADLRNADMRRADLVGVNLSEADLRGADLNGVFLIAANVYRAKYSTGENGTKFPTYFNPSSAQMLLENEPVALLHPEEMGVSVSYAATWEESPKMALPSGVNGAAGVTARKHPDATLGVTEITVGAPAAKRRSQE